MTSREQFEAWYKHGALNRIKWYQESNVMSDLTVDYDGRYLRDSIQMRWEAWQASRQDVEIEIPTRYEVASLYDVEADKDGGLLKFDEVKSTLRAAGLHIKGE